MSNQYAIMRFAKYKGPEISRIEAHNERTKETYASNPDIDPTRTHLNFHLIEPTNRYRAEAERQIAAAQCRTRTDSVRLVETLITCSPEFFKGKSEKAIRAYFQHALNFLMEKQRPETFVSAVVHLDEKTPHMHVTFVPLTQDDRLSAKDIIGNRKHLIAWQDAYWQHMVSEYPKLQRGESASKTGLKHIPPQVFKQMVRLTKQSRKIEATLDSTNMFNAKSKAEEVKHMLASYIPAVEEIATQLKKYGVAFEEVEDLQAENEQLTRELDAAKRGSITEKLEHAKLQQEYKQAKAILDRIPPEILNQLRKESRAVQRDTPEDLRHLTVPMLQLSQDELRQMLHTAAMEGAQTALEASDAFVHLDNYTHNQSEISDMSKEENDDMSRNRIRHNLIIGHNPDGTLITRWINGHTMQELIENGAALLRPEAPEKPGVPTFRKYATSWLELYKTHTVRHTTYSEYASILQKHLIPAFGDLPVTEVTTDRIQQLLNDKRDYASKTLHEIQMVLGMVLEGAVEDGLITRNPAKSKQLRNPSTKKNERQALTEEQVGDIISHLPDLKQKRDQRYLTLLIYTGMRREEVLGLRWEDVDAEKDLLQWLTHEEDNVEYVMQDNVTSSTMKRTWERIKSEINVYGATPHCFRHTFTTVCRRSGMDEKTMQVIGGWSDIATMRNVYTHVQQTDLQRAGQLMGGMFQARNLPA